MSSRKKSGRRIRTLSLIAVAVILALSLTECRGCRRKEGPGKEQLPAVGRIAEQRGVRTPPPLPSKRRPNALDKIAAAEKAGRIDLDRAWTCRLQALVDPGKLPAEFRSPERIKCGSPVLKGLNAVSGRLRPETLASLKPYLLRPTDSGSVFTSRIPARVARRTMLPVPGRLYAQEQPPPGRPTKNRSIGDWIGVGCHSAPVTIWSCLGQEVAEIAANRFDNKKLWAEIKKIMPFEPLSDADAVDSEGKPDIGIDGDLDIYLVPAGPYLTDKDGSAAGWCLTIGGAQRAPTWILVDQELGGPELDATMAHELFHSFQCALDAHDEIWWDEATATWCEQYIDKSWNTEREFRSDAFDYDLRLLKTLNSEEGDHPYGAYIFPFYLAGRFGDKFIGEIWSDCSVAGPNALTAVIGQLSGSGLEFAEAWKEFALMNYDDEKEYGRKYDETLSTFPLHFEERIMLENKSDGAKITLPPLSTWYLHVYNDGIDPAKFPAVHFDLKDLAEEPLVSVQAVIIKGGNHTVEDWTGRKERDFCLKNEADRFDDIVVVVASTEREKTLADLVMPIELGYVTECDADWIGTLSFQARFDCRYADEGEWRKTGAWRAGVGAPWEDQFTRFGAEISKSFSASATVNLALKAAAKKAESEEEKEMMESMSRLFGGVVYIQDGIKGFCSISLHEETKTTTSIRPPGKEPSVITSTTRASGGGPLTKYGMSVLSGPRLTVYPEKGEYAIEIDFSAPDIPGTSTVESSSGDKASHAFRYDGARPLFGSYFWREKWHEPVLQGKYSGDTIQGTWKSPKRSCPSQDKCGCSMLENADITLQWSLRKVK